MMTLKWVLSANNLSTCHAVSTSHAPCLLLTTYCAAWRAVLMRLRHGTNICPSRARARSLAFTHKILKRKIYVSRRMSLGVPPAPNFSTSGWVDQQIGENYDYWHRLHCVYSSRRKKLEKFAEPFKTHFKSQHTHTHIGVIMSLVVINFLPFI